MSSKPMDYEAPGTIVPTRHGDGDGWNRKRKRSRGRCKTLMVHGAYSLAWLDRAEEQLQLIAITNARSAWSGSVSRVEADASAAKKTNHMRKPLLFAKCISHTGCWIPSDIRTAILTTCRQSTPHCLPRRIRHKWCDIPGSLAVPVASAFADCFNVSDDKRVLTGTTRSPHLHPATNIRSGEALQWVYRLHVVLQASALNLTECG